MSKDNFGSSRKGGYFFRDDLFPSDNLRFPGFLMAHGRDIDDDDRTEETAAGSQLKSAFHDNGISLGFINALNH